MEAFGEGFVLFDDPGQTPNLLALKEGVDDDDLLDFGAEAQTFQEQLVGRLVFAVNKPIDEFFVHLLIVIGRKGRGA